MISKREKRSKVVHAFILAYAKQHRGLPPTMREIADFCDIPSTCSVRNCLALLQKQGLIELSGRSARNIMVVDARWIAPGAAD